MKARPLRLGVIADFNVQNLAGLLQKNSQGEALKCYLAPFGNTANVLLDSSATFWSGDYDAVVIWTLPQYAVPSFGSVLSFLPYSGDALVADVDSFANLLGRIPKEVPAILVPTWTAPELGRGWGPLDLQSGLGVANALLRMNLRLVETSQKDPRIIVLDAQRWLAAGGAAAYSPKLWYLTKTPFRPDVLQIAAEDIIAVVQGLKGSSKKILILDLDNTMWGGIVGDLGWEKLQLGGHDPIGEAYVDFQKALKRLMNRGVVIAVVSKNEESVALQAIDNHPEMILKRDCLAGCRINWGDKAHNIVDLVTELNLGLESAVFLDDSPFERARVRETLPQVLVPEMPADPMEFAQFLSGLRCFDNPMVTEEDRERTRMYVADRSRTQLKKEIVSLEAWLAKLELRVAVETLNTKNLERAAQLFNKTNQMNMATRRLTAAELLSWSEIEGHTLWTFRVADRFGDYGLCGIASLACTGIKAQMVDFLLSCRVMGRGVEEAMVATVMNSARDKGCDTVIAEIVPTKKNEPCNKWLEKLRAAMQEENRFTFSLHEPAVFPTHIAMTCPRSNEKAAFV